MRLTAIRYLFRFVLFEEPAHSALIQRVLAIPSKPHDKRQVHFLIRSEIEAILAPPDQTIWLGRRDHTLLLVAIHTGVRLSELINLDRDAIHLGAAEPAFVPATDYLPFWRRSERLNYAEWYGANDHAKDGCTSSTMRHSGTIWHSLAGGINRQAERARRRDWRRPWRRQHAQPANHQQLDQRGRRRNGSVGLSGNNTWRVRSQRRIEHGVHSGRSIGSGGATGNNTGVSSGGGSDMSASGSGGSGNSNLASNDGGGGGGATGSTGNNIGSTGGPVPFSAVRSRQSSTTKALRQRARLCRFPRPGAATRRDRRQVQIRPHH